MALQSPLNVAVIGLTGSFGGAVGRELARRGHAVTALVRDLDKGARAARGLPIRLIRGDLGDLSFLDGADVLVHGFNVPYPEWERVVPAVSEQVFSEAGRRGLTVLFPGNVYGLGRDGMDDRPLAEDAPRIATSKKGRLRNRIEDLLAERSEGSRWAAESAVPGLRAIVLRAGDYFGEADSSWYAHLVKRAVSGKALGWPGPLTLGHTWAYLPDLAVAAAELLARRGEFSTFEVFHFAAHHVTGEAMVEAIRASLGEPKKRVGRFPWGLLQLARPFSAFVRELMDVRYVWFEAMPLDGAKLAKTLGERLVTTPLQVATAAATAELTHA